MSEIPSLRRIVYNTLEAGRSETRLERLADLALMVLIAVNVVAVVLESVPSYHAAYGDIFFIVETVSVAVFTVEYMLRVWSTPEHPAVKYQHPIKGRIRYMLTPMALLDLLVIAPFYLTFFFAVDLRLLRVLRLFRVFRLTRYSSAMGLLGQVLREESANISAALFVLLMMIVVAASVTFLAEHQAQPEAFGSIPAALWWAIVTMTTIGYGDVVPITVIGKTCGAIIGIISVGMVALPAGILASGFNDALHRRRQRFESFVEGALQDGVIDTTEHVEIRSKSEELGLSEGEAAAIMHSTHQRAQVRMGYCPHCGKLIRGNTSDRLTHPHPHADT